MVAKPETRYRQKLRAAWPGWSCGYEPGFGSNDGYPDIQVLCQFTRVLVPIELKVGHFQKGSVRIFAKEVRPSQVVWHHNFWKAGGRSVILIGLEGVHREKEWTSYAFSAENLIDWRKGFHPAESIASFSQRRMAEGIQDICDWSVKGLKSHAMVRTEDIPQEGIRGLGLSLLSAERRNLLPERDPLGLASEEEG